MCAISPDNTTFKIIVAMNYHVLPINDLKKHTEDTTCECRPKVIFENGEMIVIHNSYDKREFIEVLYDIDLN